MTARAESQPRTTPAIQSDRRRPGPLSMRILEVALALGALGTAILLGLSR